MKGPYDPSAVPGSLYALQLAARHCPHERAVLADWYEEAGDTDLAAATRQLHGLYRPDATTMTEVMSSRPEVVRLWQDELPERNQRTRKRVDKMTAKETSQMPEWAEKWVKIGLSTERADRPMFEAAVAACYRYSGLKEPRAIIWAPCPIVTAYAGSIATAVLRRRGQSGDSVRDSVQASVQASVNSVGASVQASVYDSVGASVGASVYDSVDASVYDSVDASVRDSVYDSVHASVRDSVDDSVRDSVDDSVGDSVDDGLDNSNLKQWHLYNGGQFWAGGWGWWSPASVSFALDVLRLDIGRNQELKARAYAATCESACWWWPHRDFVVVSERPTLIAKRPNGKLREARWEWRDKEGALCEWSVKT